ncbi:MAG TPA: hypothetical protein VGN42_28935 [Pirellulales bacterium]|nr:hypothetical protein [Pirellulales bacterium]
MAQGKLRTSHLARSGVRWLAGMSILMVLCAVVTVPQCGKMSRKKIPFGVFIWNATDRPITDAEVLIGPVSCPAGWLTPGNRKGSSGFAVQRYETARVIWRTDDGVKHEQELKIKSALPKQLYGDDEVWFKIGEGSDVTVIVRKLSEPEPPDWENQRPKPVRAME